MATRAKLCELTVANMCDMFENDTRKSFDFVKRVKLISNLTPNVAVAVNINYVFRRKIFHEGVYFFFVTFSRLSDPLYGAGGGGRGGSFIKIVFPT